MASSKLRRKVRGPLLVWRAFQLFSQKKPSRAVYEELIKEHPELGIQTPEKMEQYMKRLIGLTSGQKIEHIFAGKNSRETWEQFIVYLNAHSRKREKIVAALKGRPLARDLREKIAAANRTPEKRAIVRAANTGRELTPMESANRSRALKKRWEQTIAKNPEAGKVAAAHANRAQILTRRQRLRQAINEGTIQEGETTFGTNTREVIAGKEFSPEREMSRREIRNLLNEEARRLSGIKRQIILEHFFEEKSLETIATETGIGLERIQKHYREALQILSRKWNVRALV